MLNKHDVIEKNSFLMLILIVVVISIGGIVEVLPLFRIETTIEPIKGIRPYTPLELEGKNIYIREGCYNCHSQQIRPLRDEVERYGHYSLAAESMYDHPFQWGSKRTGPDLARVGGKYSDAWHVQHMMNPRSVVPESIMPSYAHLAHEGAHLDEIAADMRALRKTGVPYTDDMIKNAYKDALAQARNESDDFDGLQARYGTPFGHTVNARNFDGQETTTELDALIAYLQVLGTMADFKDYEPASDVGDKE
ncbi:cytochrome-c oxidase, cbb3-type subunit II [Kordiimonas marina]|uniref:cytochrome-c oxidase, cbb3-type subunit II n=1 Tax=Kordiimonas marina TaxID=2872312 RepID=UPI001FF3A783|nr:cytochrome-c oxidase, cbb3-type subunit II [Kordiimonas marina]MCJ9427753.1 cytochrome-c oxidase, cbb3-type subunit II [Kordiimonas marina]